MPCVSVIILTWNGRKYLQECLDSLAAQTYRDFETILVDNGSGDGSAEYVRSTFPWVRLLVLPENTGFAEGNNRGLALAQGDYIVTLNNDTKADADFLAELVRVAEGGARIGMVAARMRNYYHPDRIDAAGLKIGSNGLGYNIGFGEIDDGRYDGVPLFGPCAGAALYRREMLDGVGFFDPDFFAYYEDFDLAWRGRLAGWGCAAAPRALVYHVHSATGGEWSPFKVYHAHRNKWVTIVKNWPTPVLLRYLPSVLIVDMASLCLAMLRRRGLAALRARLYCIRHIVALLRKRDVVRRKCVLSTREAVRLFSPHEHPLKTFVRKIGASREQR